MVDDLDAIAVRNAVEDVLREIEPYRYSMDDDYLVHLHALCAAFDEDADDTRLVQAAQAFLPDVVYFDGFTAQLDDALDTLRAALEG